MANSIKIVMLAVTLLLLAGCQQDKEDLAAFVAKAKARQHADIEPMPIIKTYEQFAYSAADLRDPFVRTVVETSDGSGKRVIVNNGLQPDPHRLKEALESYALSELQFVGTLEKDRLWALVRASDGVINRVQVGNYMGQNHGKILTINETELTLKEIVSNNEGGFIERDSSLFIADIS